VSSGTCGCFRAFQQIGRVTIRKRLLQLSAIQHAPGLARQVLKCWCLGMAQLVLEGARHSKAQADGRHRHGCLLKCHCCPQNTLTMPAPRPSEILRLPDGGP
jgi:hypothetical protein